MKLLSYGLDHRMEPRLAISLKGYAVDVMRASLWMKENRKALDYLNLPSSMKLALQDWNRSFALLKNLEEALKGIDDLSSLSIYDRPVALLEPDIVFFAPVHDPPSLRYFHAFEKNDRSGFSFGNTQTLLGHLQKLTHSGLTAQAEMAAIVARNGDGGNLEIAGYCIVNNWLDIGGSYNRDGASSGVATSLGPYLVTADEIEPHKLGRGFNLDLQVRINGNPVIEGRFKDMKLNFLEMTGQSEKTRVLAGDVFCSGSPLNPNSNPVLKHNDHIEVEIQALGVLSTSVASVNGSS